MFYIVISRSQRYKKEIIQTNNLIKNEKIQRNNSTKIEKIQRNNSLLFIYEAFCPKRRKLFNEVKVGEHIY